jgi:2-dehydropantoate 2-reductase
VPDRTTAAIVGAGAIGGWLAFLLDRAGWDVKLVARGATLAALQDGGLKVEADGEPHVLDLEAHDRPAAIGPVDYVILTLKGHGLAEMGARLGSLVGPETTIVTAMNGLQWWFTDGLEGPLDGQALDSVDPGGVLRGLFPVDRVIGCVVHAAVTADAPGAIRVVATDKLIIGEPGGPASGRVERLADALRRGGCETEVSSDIRLAIWRKLWGNMCMNPLSALTRASTGPLLDDPLTAELIEAMMMEMSALGDRLGLRLDMTPQERMAVTRRLGDFRTSMQRDAEAGRRMELDGLLGVLVEIAQRLDQPAPNLRAVYGLSRRLDAAIAAG